MHFDANYNVLLKEIQWDERLFCVACYFRIGGLFTGFRFFNLSTNYMKD
jgi:hypothetical protein